MPKKHNIYWYQEDPNIAKAFLYNCRDRDLQQGGSTSRGSIVQGVCGFSVAECDIPGFTASVVPTFHANRQCEWMGFTLPCMAHPQTPVGALTKQQLRPYNYVVARLSDAAAQHAQSSGLPVVTHADGSCLANLELSVFQRQGVGSPRRATLL